MRCEKKIASSIRSAFEKATANLACDVSSPKNTEIVYEILNLSKKQSSSRTLDKPLIDTD